MRDAIYQEIGRRIRYERRKKKINQSMLAWNAGFERATTISEIEKGKTRVQIDTLYRIAQLLEISVYDLLPSQYRT